jgi:hypothetical protein
MMIGVWVLSLMMVLDGWDPDGEVYLILVYTSTEWQTEES